eukprot:gene16277-biopygen16396
MESTRWNSVPVRSTVSKARPLSLHRLKKTECRKAAMYGWYTKPLYTYRSGVPSSARQSPVCGSGLDPVVNWKRRWMRELLVRCRSRSTAHIRSWLSRRKTTYSTEKYPTTFFW